MPVTLNALSSSAASSAGLMVLYVKPVADVLPLAVDGQPLARERVEDRQRDQLFGKVIWAVIVGAI